MKNRQRADNLYKLRQPCAAVSLQVNGAVCRGNRAQPTPNQGSGGLARRRDWHRVPNAAASAMESAN
eukprot:11228009-Lingulodinium_polyedra.AAC.1